MKKYAKWLGGGIGWALGGPIGAFMGYTLGTMWEAMDSGTYEATTKKNHRTAPGDFTTSLLILSAAIMKADGRTMKSELEYVRVFFHKQFGIAHANEQMQILKEILKKEIPLNEVCQQIRHHMDQASKLQLLHYLYGISASDGQVHSDEVKLIHQIAIQLGLNPADIGSIKSMYFDDTDTDYKILEIAPSASDEEVKKAYKRMAVKYHPDKVSHLGEDIQKAAKEKFQRMQQAYEHIKKTRNIK